MTTDQSFLTKKLSRQVATEIVPQVVASIIYEESSDSDQNRVIGQFRNQKRVGKKTRNQRRFVRFVKDWWFTVFYVQ